MRRNAALIVLSGAGVIFLSGCLGGQNTADPYAGDTSTDMYASTSTDQTYNDPTTSGTPGTSDPYASAYGSPTESASGSTSGGQYHTVLRKDTLYSLARQYYGDQRRWKEIYQANGDVLSDPNRIFVGQRLLIP